MKTGVHGAVVGVLRLSVTGLGENGRPRRGGWRPASVSDGTW